MKVLRAGFFDSSLPNSAFRLYPSSFPRVPLAVPYWNGETCRAILRSLFSGTVIEGPDVQRLQSSVMATLGVENADLCGSGSLALEIALRACGVGHGDEVIIPTFCCTAVVAPILAVGAVPVLADVGAELNITAETANAALTKKTKAIIVPHLFGNPAEIGAIVDLARDKHIRVIDDAAQALGATIDPSTRAPALAGGSCSGFRPTGVLEGATALPVGLHGHPVGSFGDVGILSFGSEKVCFGLGGGVVVYRGKDLFNPSTRTPALAGGSCSGFRPTGLPVGLHGAVALDLAPAQVFTSLRTLLSTVFSRRWRRWTLPLLSRVMNPSGPDAPSAPYRAESMANLNAAVAVSLMRTLRENIAARRARVDAYRELLGTEEGLTLIPHRVGSACLTQVVRLLPRRRDEDSASEIIQALGRAGFEVQGSYVPIHLLPRYRQWLRAPLAHAEQVWSDLIELPCEPSVSVAHLERITDIVKRVLKC
jgi:dTDP-4-amino-4,6-dideoxygalactose transaminase